MPRNPECTFALLQMGEAKTKSNVSRLRNIFGSFPFESPKDFESRLNTAAGVVAQTIIHDACDKIGRPIRKVQFDKIPNDFHIIVMFGMCLLMGIVVLLQDEGYTIDVEDVAPKMIDALLIMRSTEEKTTQYKLGHALLMKFIKLEGNWRSGLNQLIKFYLIDNGDSKFQNQDYPSLFGSLLKTLLSEVELPD